MAANGIVIRRVCEILIIVVKVLMDTSLAEGDLVDHAEGVDNLVMLVAEKDSSLRCIGVMHHLSSGHNVLICGSCHIVTHGCLVFSGVKNI